MSDDPTTAFVKEAAALQGLQLDAGSLAGVVTNTHVLRAFAADFVDWPLPADLDPAGLLRL